MSLETTEISELQTSIVMPEKEARATTRTIGFYRREIMPSLGPEVFELAWGRLVWFALCGMASLAAFYAIVFLNPAWPIKLLLGISIGVFNGIIGFVTHELLHGTVTKNSKVQAVVGYLGLMPYLISPTYWKFVHNKLHHGKTQATIRDPDAFPTMRIYKSSKFVQAIFPFTPGSGYKRSYFYFFFWLSFHEFVAQIYLRFRNGLFDSMDNRRVTIELSSQVAILIAMLVVAGPSNWLYVMILPIMGQNYLLMSYISTNHNLSPLTSENDPLVNSLTVTNHPVIEFFTLNFGYHVEHHLFPTVSSKHAKVIHRALIAKFPETYKYMPKWTAMKKLYATSRIYKNSTTLIHPETLEMFETI
ncbi:acyl-CoA desaturase [soil metagenome]